MAIQITLVKAPVKVSVSKTSQTFHKQGGTLGRGESNAWVLPDPDKFLSSCHCEILCDSSKYYLLDLSTNGTFFNNALEPLGKGARSPLADGDVFEMGEYRFSVKLIAEQGLGGSSPFAMANTGGGGQLSSDNIFGGGQAGFNKPYVGGGFLADDIDEGISNRGVNPLAYWGNVGPDKAPTMGGAKGSGSQFDPITGSISPTAKSYIGTTANNTPGVNESITWPKTTNENLIPENWGDDLDFNLPPGGTTAGKQPLIAEPFGDEPFAEPFSDEPFAQPIAPVGGHAHRPIQPGIQSKGLAAHGLQKGHPQGFTEGFGGDFPDVFPDNFNPGFAAEPQSIIPEPTKHQRPIVQPERPQAPPVAMQPSGYTQPSGHTQPSGEGQPNHRLIAAMGLDSSRLSAEQIDNITDMVGELMRETVSGMMQVLRSRTSIKNEFRMNVTTIQPVENNPLKFSVGVDEALENMFIKKTNAYKKPVDAFREGFQEIGEHQVAVIAGIRHGFDKMIQRFDPEQLEQIFNKHGKGSIIPGMQKTKYWTSYCDHYAGFIDNMESSFQHLFGSDFVNAYEEQLRKLAAARKKK